MLSVLGTSVEESRDDSLRLEVVDTAGSVATVCAEDTGASEVVWGLVGVDEYSTGVDVEALVGSTIGGDTREPADDTISFALSLKVVVIEAEVWSTELVVEDCSGTGEGVELTSGAWVDVVEISSAPTAG